MRRYPKRYLDAGISPARLRELQGFCMQYREYQRRLRRARAGIEDSAAAVASPVVAQAILRSVADGARYDVMRPPIGPNQFYERRQAFFIELDRRLRDLSE